ncbi:MAG TPA: hypothetical protein VF519_00830 [Mycobacteriales bacterium]
MSRRLLAAAALAVVATPVAAAGAAFTVRDPVRDCTYTVWGPTVTVTSFVVPGVSVTGGYGYSTTC